MISTYQHIPVLLHEAVQAVQPRSGGVYVDATFGGGGYSKEILKTEGASVIAIDRDPDAIARAHMLQQEVGHDRLTVFEGPFSQLDAWIKPQTVDGVVFDFGVSSFQIDQPERGFSFRFDGPLDMRMSFNQNLTAFDIVNTFSESDLSDIIYTYGQDPKSRIIARAIVQERREQPIQTTLELANIVRGVIPRTGRIDPCTLTFQALRMFVNDELIEIDGALKKLGALIRHLGYISAVSFHELEDRLVKQVFRELYKPLSSKPIMPSQDDCRRNPRCRSARLRVAQVV